jgi:hypothetical protein
MESKKTLSTINISLIICLLAFVAIDFWLSRVGQTTFIFKAKFPEGITIAYDNLQGYKILEEGFIHILDERTIYGEDTITAILAYDASQSDVFIKSRNSAGNIVYLNIHVLESVNAELKYELTKYKSTGNEGWVDISNKDRIRLVVTLRNVLVGIMLVMFIIKLLAWFRSTFFRQS